MTKRKTQKTRSKPVAARPAPISYDSMAVAAAALHLSKPQLQKAKAAGAPGFRGSRVYPGELLPWLEKNRAALASVLGKDEADLEKRIQEIRKLRLANDQKEGRLIERAWVASRIQAMASDITSFRLKSETEHPTKFAAAAGDVAACRTIVRGIWDHLMRDFQSLHTHLQEGPR